ncbi:hypothetical protein V5E38_06820 [Rossellomorea sp. GAMAL-10_SWC]
MSDEINKEILKELKEINVKLERLVNDQNKGLSSPVKLVALCIGFFILPMIFSVVIPLINRIFG